MFIRLVLFIFLVYFSINYLSSSSIDISLPQVNIYQYLPPKSQQILSETLQKLQSSDLNNKFDQFLNYIKEFPQKHLQQLKIDIINRIAQELINRIDQH